MLEKAEDKMLHVYSCLATCLGLHTSYQVQHLFITSALCSAPDAVSLFGRNLVNLETYFVPMKSRPLRAKECTCSVQDFVMREARSRIFWLHHPFSKNRVFDSLSPSLYTSFHIYKARAHRLV
jgi:hypothetical protein